jgi:hypothetical protein
VNRAYSWRNKDIFVVNRAYIWRNNDMGVYFRGITTY